MSSGAGLGSAHKALGLLEGCAKELCPFIVRDAMGPLDHGRGERSRLRRRAPLTVHPERPRPRRRSPELSRRAGGQAAKALRRGRRSVWGEQCAGRLRVREWLQDGKVWAQEAREAARNQQRFRCAVCARNEEQRGPKPPVGRPPAALLAALLAAAPQGPRPPDPRRASARARGWSWASCKKSNLHGQVPMRRGQGQEEQVDALRAGRPGAPRRRLDAAHAALRMIAKEGVGARTGSPSSVDAADAAVGLHWVPPQTPPVSKFGRAAPRIALYCRPALALAETALRQIAAVGLSPSDVIHDGLRGHPREAHIHVTPA